MSREFWEDRYAEQGHAYGTEPNAFLRGQARRIERGPVLCLAAGQGRNAVFLAERGPRVEAVDQSAVGLLAAQQLAEARGVRVDTVVADLADHPIGAAVWGAVVSIFCQLPQPLRRDLHRRVVTGLRPGGVLIMEAYTPRQLDRATGGPPDAALLYEPEEIWAEIEGLEPIIFDELDREVLEGRYHTGLSAVLQVVAVKRDPTPCSDGAGGRCTRTSRASPGGTSSGCSAPAATRVAMGQHARPGAPRLGGAMSGRRRSRPHAMRRQRARTRGRTVVVRR